MTAEQPVSNGSTSVSAGSTASFQWEEGKREGAALVMPAEGYKQIQRKIKEDLGRQSPSVWVGLAFTFLGIAATGLVSLILFPTNATGLPAGARANLTTVSIAAAVIFLFCLAFHLSKRTGLKRLAQGICDDMDIHAGVQRPEEAKVKNRRHRLLGIEVTLHWGPRR